IQFIVFLQAKKVSLNWRFVVPLERVDKMENQIVKSVHLEDQIRDKNRATKKNGEMTVLQDVTNHFEEEFGGKCFTGNTDLSNSQTLTRTRCSEKWSQKHASFR
ncbi:hypothetical protein D917_10724, partial [Trichinella nativa]